MIGECDIFYPLQTKVADWYAMKGALQHPSAAQTPPSMPPEEIQSPQIAQSLDSRRPPPALPIDNSNIRIKKIEDEIITIFNAYFRCSSIATITIQVEWATTIFAERSRDWDKA